MTGSSRAQAFERRGLSGQPLMMVVGVVMLWIWIRAFWWVLDAPVVQAPNAPMWPLAHFAGAPAHVSSDVLPVPLAATLPATTPRIATLRPIAVQTAGFSGGQGGVSFDKWLRLTALGGQWDFAHRPAASEGWRAGYWRAGTRDAQLAASMTRRSSLPVTTGLGIERAESEPVSLAAGSRRWAAAAWLLARPGSTIDQDAPIARYGASQAGALIEYRVGGDASPRAYLRASRALVGGGETEIAAGMKFAIGDLPVAAHVERRFAANSAGRNAMALFVSGGFAAGDRTRLATEAYGQAGIVGLRRQVPFVDAALVARRQIVARGPLSLSVGGGGWIGAQPGASRVEIGPRIEAQYDDGLQGRLSLDWRERVDGSAEPRSGPAMTLALSF